MRLSVRPLASALLIAALASGCAGVGTPPRTASASPTPDAGGSGEATSEVSPPVPVSGATSPSAPASTAVSPDVAAASVTPSSSTPTALAGLSSVTGVVLGASDEPDAAATLTWRTTDPASACVRLESGAQRRTLHGEVVLARPRVLRATLPAFAQSDAPASYRIGDCVDRWTDPVPVRRPPRSADTLLFFGDPQLTTDAAGWRDTLAAATRDHPDVALLLLAGDVADEADDVHQWALATDPAALRTLPVLSLRGNHDVGSAEFDARFAADGHHDRVLRRGDVLLVVLDTYAGDVATHEATLRRAVAAHPDAPWRVVAFHQAPFSGGGHLEAADVTDLRRDLAPVLSRLGVDLVLTGHDHHYARSLLMEGARPVPGTGAATLTARRGRTLYVTAGSASGSQYFPLAAARDWTAVVAQPFRPSYVSVEADAGMLQVTATTASGESIDRVTLRR